MITKQEFKKQLTEQLEDSYFLKSLSWNERDTILAQCLDQVMDWMFTIQVIDNEEHDMIIDWYIENLYQWKWMYVELDTMFDYEWDNIENVVERLADKYQEYIDMRLFFNWVN